MPVKSYLAHPTQGNLSILVSELSALEGCEVIPSTNEELAVLVTDTNTEAEDQILLEQIKEIDCLKMLSMVSGFHTEDQNIGPNP